jgi:hypothetical protein
MEKQGQRVREVTEGKRMKSVKYKSMTKYVRIRYLRLLSASLVKKLTTQRKYSPSP